MSHSVLALCAGTPRPFRGDIQSGIAKQMLSGAVRITTRGIEGDQQADTDHHGGPDMAVHHYPIDHHDFWREELGGHQLLDQAGAFGSNLALRGMTEGAVLLGDRFQLGSAVLEACQPRQPCWKIEHRFGRKGMVKTIMATGKCGWFYRVIEEGEARAGDRMELVGHGQAGWSMARIFNALWGSTAAPDPELLAEIAALELLPEKLRLKIRKKQPTAQ